MNKKNTSVSPIGPARTAWLLGGVHMLVDLASIATLYTALKNGPIPPGWAAALI